MTGNTTSRLLGVPDRSPVRMRFAARSDIDSPSRQEVHDSRVLHAAGVGEHHGVDRIDRLGRNRGLGSAKSKTSSAKIALIDFAKAGAPNTFVHVRPPERRSIPVLLKTKPQLYWLGLIFRSYDTGKQALYPGGTVDAYFRPS